MTGLSFEEAFARLEEVARVPGWHMASGKEYLAMLARDYARRHSYPLPSRRSGRPRKEK
jgi:hypothetical protein